MPFTSRSRASAPSGPTPEASPAPAPAPPEGEDQGLVYDGAALHQDPAVIQRRDRQDPARLASDEGRERQAILRALNTLRVIAPALNQAIAGGGSDQEQSTRFAQIMGSAREFATIAATELGLDPDQDRNRWAIGMLERAYMEMGHGLALEVGPALRQAALAVAHEQGQDSRVPEKLGEASLIQLAMIRTLPKIAQAQAQFNFYRPRPEEDLKAMGQLLLDAATQVLQTIADPITPDHERQTLLVALVEEGGRLLADTWNHMAKVAARLSKSRTPEQMAIWRNNNPEGLPLHQVEERFRQQMATLGKLLKAPRKRR